MEDAPNPIPQSLDSISGANGVALKQPKKRKGGIVFIVLFLVGLVAGVFVYMFFFKADLVRYTSEENGYSFMYDANKYEILEGGVDWAVNLETKMSIRVDKGLYEYFLIYDDSENGRMMHEIQLKVTSDQRDDAYEDIFVLDGEEFFLLGGDMLFTADDGVERMASLRHLSGEHDGREYYIHCMFYRPEMWDTFVDTFVFE